MGEMKITYLDGMGDSGFGAATVHTNVRKGYVSRVPECRQVHPEPQIFDLSMENDDDGR